MSMAAVKDLAQHGDVRSRPVLSQILSGRPTCAGKNHASAPAVVAGAYARGLITLFEQELGHHHTH
jgi:hypothetical protein